VFNPFSNVIIIIVKRLAILCRKLSAKHYIIICNKFIQFFAGMFVDGGSVAYFQFSIRYKTVGILIIFICTIRKYRSNTQMMFTGYFLGFKQFVIFYQCINAAYAKHASERPAICFPVVIFERSEEHTSELQSRLHL